MLSDFYLANFKSYIEARLPLNEVTVLIGANASGKSNLIEGLQLLHWLALGRRLSDLVFSVTQKQIAVRGTLDKLVRSTGEPFVIGCSTKTKMESFSFSISLLPTPEGMRIRRENLASSSAKTSMPLYWVERPASAPGNDVWVAYNNFSTGQNKPQIVCTDQQAIFTQLTTPARFEARHRKSQAEIPAAAGALVTTLSKMLFLDPMPVRMRDYSFTVERQLQGDGANVSAVLHNLCQAPGGKEQVLKFIKSLPEQDFGDLAFLKGPRGEVMVQLVETFGGQSASREAATLSDGTLRVLAVAAALHSVEEGAMVVIEEIDNGVHPPRAKELIENIQRVARARKLQVLLTTHNPALLDALPADVVPNAVFCYRDPLVGDSKLVKLDEIEDYPSLIAQGPLGELVARGLVDRFAKSTTNAERREKEIGHLRAILGSESDVQ